MPNPNQFSPSYRKRIAVLVLGRVLLLFMLTIILTYAVTHKPPKAHVQTSGDTLVAASGFQGSTGVVADSERPPMSVHEELHKRLATKPVVAFDNFTVAGYSKTLTLSNLYQDDVKVMWQDLFLDDNLKQQLANYGVNTRQLIGVYHDYKHSMGTVQLTVGYVLPQTIAQKFEGSGHYGSVVVDSGQYEKDRSNRLQTVLMAWSELLSDPSNLNKDGSRYRFKTDFERYTVSVDGEVSKPVLYLGVNISASN